MFSIACSTVVSSPMRVAFAAEREAVESEVKQASKATDSSVEEGVIAANKSIQYLSDMKEEPGASVGYWGQIFKDCVVNKGNEKKDNLWVRYNNETLKFAKGIGAHATSTVIYNITDLMTTRIGRRYIIAELSKMRLNMSKLILKIKNTLNFMQMKIKAMEVTMQFMPMQDSWQRIISRQMVMIFRCRQWKSLMRS